MDEGEKEEKACKYFIPGLNIRMNMSLDIKQSFPLIISSINEKPHFLSKVFFEFLMHVLNLSSKFNMFLDSRR